MSELERMTVSQGQQPLSYKKYLALLESAAAILIEPERKEKLEMVIKPNPPQAMGVGEEEETIKDDAEAEVITMLEEGHNKTGKTTIKI